MARFVGTAEEFKRYFGPHARNYVQRFTRAYKKQVGACEHCGETTRLEAAHVHDRGRNALIDKVLGVDRSDAAVDVDLATFEEAFLAAHRPLEKSFKILCSACHRKYDAAVGASEASQRDSKTKAATHGKAGVLPITLDPPSPEAFKAQLLRTQLAQIAIYYASGRVEHKTWKAQIFSAHSNLIGNLRSRPEFRKGAWQDADIQRIHVSIVETGK